MPKSPSAPMRAMTASGIQLSSSQAPAWGASSARAKSRAVSRIMRCSSVRKSLCARVSIRRRLLGLLVDFLDVRLDLRVDVGAEPLGGLERLHLRAERAFGGALRRLGALGRGIDLRCLGLAAARRECRDAHRGAHAPRGPAHARTAFTRWRMSARTLGGK